MAEKSRRKMLLTGINAQRAKSYRVAVILCIILRGSSWIWFYFTITELFSLTIFLSYTSFSGIWAELCIFWVENIPGTGRHKNLQSHSHLVGDFPKRVWVSTTDESTAFNSFHSPDFFQPSSFASPHLPELSGSLCILKRPGTPRASS